MKINPSFLAQFFKGAEGVWKSAGRATARRTAKIFSTAVSFFVRTEKKQPSPAKQRKMAKAAFREAVSPSDFRRLTAVEATGIGKKKSAKNYVLKSHKGPIAPEDVISDREHNAISRRARLGVEARPSEAKDISTPYQTAASEHAAQRQRENNAVRRNLASAKTFERPPSAKRPQFHLEALRETDKAAYPGWRARWLAWAEAGAKQGEEPLETWEYMVMMDVAAQIADERVLKLRGISALVA